MIVPIVLIHTQETFLPIAEGRSNLFQKPPPKMREQHSSPLMNLPALPILLSSQSESRGRYYQAAHRETSKRCQTTCEKEKEKEKRKDPPVENASNAVMSRRRLTPLQCACMQSSISSRDFEWRDPSQRRAGQSNGARSTPQRP